jgi:hypothetical protein
MGSIPPPPPPPPPPSAAAKPQIKLDLSAISRNDQLVAGGTFILFIALFLPWFSVKFGVLGTFTASGLSAHGYLYVTLIVAIALIALLAAEVLGLWKLPASSALSRDQILLIGTLLNLLLVVLAFVFKPGGHGVGWSWGAFVGLIAAVVAAFPLGWPLLQAKLNKK